MMLTPEDLKNLPAPNVADTWELIPTIADIAHKPTGLHLPDYVRGEVTKAPAVMLVATMTEESVPTGRVLSGPPLLTLLMVDKDGRAIVEAFAESVKHAARDAGAMWAEHLKGIERRNGSG